MTNEQDVTLGEVARTCERIETLVKDQNSRVTKLEQDSIRIKAYWSSAGLILALGGDWLKHKLGL